MKYFLSSKVFNVLLQCEIFSENISGKPEGLFHLTYQTANVKSEKMLFKSLFNRCATVVNFFFFFFTFAVVKYTGKYTVSHNYIATTIIHV